MSTRLIFVPNKLAIAANAGEMAANDASPFTEKRIDDVEIRAAAAISCASALVAKLSDRKAVQMPSLEPVKPIVPSMSRSAALVSGLDAKAKEFTTTPPSQSGHLSTFESINRLIANAHEKFTEKWAPVVNFANSNENYSDDDIRSVIAQAGDPTEYEVESERIKSLSAESASHLTALGEHVSAYQKAHGADDSIRETAERVQASLSELAPAKATTAAADVEGDEEENNPGAGYGPGHGTGELLSESVKKLWPRSER